MEKYNLYGKCNLYISPVFGMIEPEEIVDFMKENVMNDVNMQIQLHKIIWSLKNGSPPVRVTFFTPVDKT